MHMDIKLARKTYMNQSQVIKICPEKILLGTREELSGAVGSKLLVNEAIEKSILMYGIQLWASESNFNIDIIKRQQN